MEPVLHVRRVPAQSPSCEDGNQGRREVFASLNDRKVQGQRHVCAQNVVGIARLKLSMFSDDLMGRGTPVHRSFVLSVYLNVVTHVVTHDPVPVRNRISRGYIETVTKGTPGCNPRQSIRKVGFDGKRTFLTTPTDDGD